MSTEEALRKIAEKIETDATNYRNMVEHGAIVYIEEKADSGTVEVVISKRDK